MGEARLWDLRIGKLVEEVKPVTVKCWMVCIRYPYIFIVGGDDWDGLQIWHFPENRLVRRILEDFPLHNIHISDPLLTLSELKDVADPENKECIVVVLDIRELTAPSMPVSNLWSRRFSFQPGDSTRHPDQVNAVSNATSVIVSHDTFLTVIDFWGEL